MEKSNAKQRQRPPQAEVLGDVVTVRGRLALLGWKSIAAWAHAYGYERQMVSYTVRTWAQRTDRRPHGGLSRAVMRDLRETLSLGIRPEHKAVASAQ